MEFEEIKNLIDGSLNIDFGLGVSDDTIRKAEEKLEFTFPKEYKLWLKNYGWGEIYGEDIFGLYNEEFNSYPNVVIIGKTKCAKKIRYGFQFLAGKNRSKITKFKHSLKMI